MKNKIDRIIIHWTAGINYPNATDLEHYHFLADKDGKIHKGKFTPEDNFNCLDGQYSQHSGGNNTNAIGFSFCGMCGFESEDKIGNYPITLKQFEAGCKCIAELCIKYDIKFPNKNNVFTHYELGKRIQNVEIERTQLNSVNVGKLDVCHLPHLPHIKADQVGNLIRSTIRWYMQKIKSGDNV